MTAFQQGVGEGAANEIQSAAQAYIKFLKAMALARAAWAVAIANGVELPMPFGDTVPATIEAGKGAAELTRTLYESGYLDLIESNVPFFPEFLRPPSVETRCKN